jgi:WD40 repeat protein
LDVETGTLLEDYVSCWEPSAAARYSGSFQQQQQQLLLQQQVNPLLQTSVVGSAAGLGLAWDDPSSGVVSAVCHGSSKPGSGWVAAGSGSGRATLLDLRAGRITATWQAHSQWVSQLQGLAVGSQGDTQLLSCSHDKTLKLWDLRMLRPEVDGPRFCALSQGLGPQTVEPVIGFKGVKEGIDGFVVYQDAAIVYGGSHLGLAPMNVQHVSNNVIYPVKMTAIRGAGRAAAGGGGGSGSAIVGLGLLPHSRLLVVGSEDGQVRICR